MGRAKGPGGGGNSGKAGIRSKPPYNLKTRIIGQLRRLFLWHPGLKQVRDRARVERGVYRCESCKALCAAKVMRCDHVEPVVSVLGFVDWNTYISRLFDSIPDGIQYICKTCHAEKTARERVARRDVRHGKAS